MGCPRLTYYEAANVQAPVKTRFAHLSVVKKTSESFENIDDDYRYGFQGQEKDDEIKGKGNSVNYSYRMHDSRLGRFLSIDPLAKEYPHYTPYSFSANQVIHSVELEGLETRHDLNGFYTDEGLAPLRATLTPEETAAAKAVWDKQQAQFAKGVLLLVVTAAVVVDVWTTGGTITSTVIAGYYATKGADNYLDITDQQELKPIIIPISPAPAPVVTSSMVPAVTDDLIMSETALSKGLNDVKFNEVFDDMWDALTHKSVYHKGSPGDLSKSTKSTFSTGTDKASVSSLDRVGTVSEYKVPNSVMQNWLDEGQAWVKTDLDKATGVINEEIQFSKEVFKELETYKVVK